MHHVVHGRHGHSKSNSIHRAPCPGPMHALPPRRAHLHCAACCPALNLHGRCLVAGCISPCVRHMRMRLAVPGPLRTVHECVAAPCVITEHARAPPRLPAVPLACMHVCPALPLPTNTQHAMPSLALLPCCLPVGLALIAWPRSPDHDRALELRMDLSSRCCSVRDPIATAAAASNVCRFEARAFTR